MKTINTMFSTLMIFFVIGCNGSSPTSNNNDHKNNKDPQDESCNLGSEGCACISDDSCDSGLICLSNICVQIDDNDQADAGSSDVTHNGEDLDAGTTTGDSISYTYKIVDTGVQAFYSDDSVISSPAVGENFYGQDATYNGNQPNYTDNGDGTITDHVTGLMWQQDMGSKVSFAEAFGKAENMTLGGYSDWRVPTIKELFSLILYTGQLLGENADSMFIDTNYFHQPLGDTSIGEREIDAQTWSSNEYVGQTMHGNETVFGVNFVDGRIKGYPKFKPPQGTVPNTMYFRMVRENPDYGTNTFVDNGNGTVSDLSTGLMWQKADDGLTRNWESALLYAEDLTLGGYDNWKLPNAKELHSIVDYSRAPAVTQSAAMDSVFEATTISDPDGNSGQYGYYWTSSSHLDGINPYASAAYISFGEAQGKMNGNLMDVHGAGAVRSDPKAGEESSYPKYHGPQGDVQYVYNFVRACRVIE